MEEQKPRFMSFAEATDWAMERIEKASGGSPFESKSDAIFKLCKEKGIPVVEHKCEFKEMTKEVKYQRWLIEVGELKEQLETQLDNSQDIWMDAQEFKSWLVKKDGHWYDVERAMQQVYSHIDSALHFLKIIRGEEK